MNKKPKYIPVLLKEEERQEIIEAAPKEKRSLSNYIAYHATQAAKKLNNERHR